ncbi:heavy-metal-associated domain-containing protein [Haloechinothrix sp. YIM 98757]|uniref:Heavy-metal-associated domain-containing protein n=1 Tax=Haloechinothrix aidingensis TaxID=2752311 RepID=A0A838AE84_9PSEU|nr:heavy-metal-associated domain-containing protein [Haloechinothrix aidingensis]
MAEATTYTVTGMTCGHCAQAVRDELERVDGVTEVSVDVATGAVTVRGEQPVPDERVRAAVEEAGYEVAGQQPAV